MNCDKKGKSIKKYHHTKTRLEPMISSSEGRHPKPLRHLHHIQELNNPPSQIRFLPSIGGFINYYADVDG